MKGKTMKVKVRLGMAIGIVCGVGGVEVRADEANVIDSVRERLSQIENGEKKKTSRAPASVAEDDAPAGTAAEKPKKKKKHHATRAPASAGDWKRAEPPSRPSATRPSQEVAPVPESPEEEESRLTKNWGGPRKTLSEKGIDLGLTYKAEFTRVYSGGVERKSNTLGNVDLKASIDAEKLVGWSGGSLFFYVLNDHGGHPSQASGDSQGTSNLETVGFGTKLYEAWVQQIAFDAKASFLFGLHDLNSEFYVTDTSGLFFNASFGIGKELSQTGENGPSIFPNTALALRIRTEPSQHFYMQVGAFGAKAGDKTNPRGTHVNSSLGDGLLMITEAAYTNGKGAEGGTPAKYAVGVWNYTEVYDHQTTTYADTNGNDVPAKAASHGAYFLADQGLSEQWSAFLRYGVASTEVNRFASCLGFGVVSTGLIPGRAKDRWGLAVARAVNGDVYQSTASDGAARWETTYEMNYRAEVLRGIALQPDVQYIVNPGADTLPNAWVGAFRVELNF
ncbi:MAG: carbohydrate porin [Bdellovibrionales bacterium]|nr:carbohydrate porin [Bdellovibrionales bacterium]